MQKKDCFLFGTIFKLHGYKGDVNIYNEDDIPFDFSTLKYFLIEQNNELIPFFKKVLADGRGLIRKAHFEGCGGLELSRVRSTFIDTVLRSLWSFACSSFNKTDSEIRCSLLAIGGYGRGELSPSSDVDLLFVVTSIDSENHDLTQKVLYLLWDVGLDIGGNIVDSDPVMVPTFVDIDGDNDLDFFTGNSVGTVTFYENVGFQDNLPLFEFITNFWEEIYIVGSSANQRHGASAISFIDLDEDGDYDLTWGDYFQQSLYVILNEGDDEEAIMDNDNIINQFPIDDPVITSGLNMTSFCDIDNDGDMDLFISVLSGAFGFQLKNNFICIF